MFTNMDDIKSYVIAKGKDKKHSYFAVWDVSYKVRNLVITDFAHIGITAARLSGSCEELGERNFTF